MAKATEVTPAKKEKVVKPLSDVKKLKNLMREINPIDAVLLVERIQTGTGTLKKAMETEKNPVLLSMYESIVSKVEKNLPVPPKAVK